MKEYIKSTIYVLFVIITFFALLNAFLTFENPFSIYENPLIWVVLLAFFLVIITKEVVNVTAIKKAKKLQIEKDGINPESIKQNTWITSLLQKWTKSKPLEEQDEIVLDHNYDGIRELDNVLPPWWVYMFYMTIIFAIVYIVRYEFLGADSQIIEYEKEVAEAKVAIEKHKKNTPNIFDESKIVLLTDDASLKRGKAIYDLNCIACHAVDGGGGIGPNLTDNYWISGGGLKNIYQTITKGGRGGKGMVAWEKIIKPEDRVKVTSYILSLQGTSPTNPKDPEGDIWKE